MHQKKLMSNRVKHGFSRLTNLDHTKTAHLEKMFFFLFILQFIMCKCQEMIPLGEIGTLSEAGEFSEIFEIDEEEVLGY